jgi:hypothetical protein
MSMTTLHRLWAPAAFAALAAIGCSSAATSTDLATEDRRGSDATGAPRSGIGVDQAIACSEQYQRAPALGVIDFEPARTPSAVVTSSIGHVDGVLTRITTAPGAASSITAIVDGEERTITSEPVLLHLEVDVTAVAGEAGSVRVGETATIVAAFTAELPGSRSAVDADELLASIQAACPAGMHVRAYASQVEGTEVAAPPWSVLLVADDAFHPLYPPEASAAPFGVSTLAEFEAAAGR